MAAAAFSTKARSLEALGDSLASARILPLVHFTYREWQEERGLCQLRTLQALGSHPLIVRSSCGRERRASSVECRRLPLPAERPAGRTCRGRRSGHGIVWNAGAFRRGADPADAPRRDPRWSGLLT